MKFISFYTGHYEWDAEQLIKSMKKLGIHNYDVESRDSLGKWETNTQMKAPFILEKLLENDAVVWTDADSRIRSLPIFFDTIDTDIGVYYLPREKAGEFKLPYHSILKDSELQYYLQSGTMYFKNNDKVIRLIKRWIELNKEDPRQWDQWTLQYAIMESDVTVTPLPESYVWVSGTNDGSPVIEHTQASRRYKHKIG